MKTLELLLITMRPQRWWRYTLVFLPLLFTGDLLNFVYLIKLSVAFIIFAILSGSISIIDDIVDFEEDKKDPIKRTLPVASGELSRERAEFGVAVLLIGAFTAAYLLGSMFGLVCSGYFFVSLSYFLLLKNYFILDAITVSVEMSLCLIAGTIAILKPVSPWLLVFVMLLSMLLVFCERKRKLLLDWQKDAPSAAHDGPSGNFLDSFINLSGPLVLSIYILYARIGPDGIKYNLIYTVPFVLYGVFRIFYLTYDLRTAKPLEKQLATDPATFLNVALWVILVAVLMRIGA
ncbi:MAG: UbiA family prenyltransferase [Candidatus Margulisiibacteriota bacterium]